PIKLGARLLTPSSSKQGERASSSDPARVSASRGSAGVVSRLAAAQAGPGPVAAEESAPAHSWKRASLETLACFIFSGGVLVTVGPVGGFAVRVASPTSLPPLF